MAGTPRSTGGQCALGNIETEVLGTLDYSCVRSFQIGSRITQPDHVIFAIFLVPAEEKLNKQKKGMRREKEEEKQNAYTARDRKCIYHTMAS